MTVARHGSRRRVGKKGKKEVKSWVGGSFSIKNLKKGLGRVNTQACHFLQTGAVTPKKKGQISTANERPFFGERVF